MTVTTGNSLISAEAIDVNDVLRWMARDARWRRSWERDKDTPRRWSILREMYAEITPEILAGDRRGPYVLEWDFTPIEYDLWQSVRYYGLPFWPQYPVGRYFVDFGDPVRRIALEADGHDFHDARRDAQRDAELGALGWRVFRFEGWRCWKGADDPESADAKLVEQLSPYYESLRWTKDS